MDRILAERIFGVPWTVLAVIALVVALVYIFVDTSGGATGWRWAVMRWFHSLCWILLAAGALARAKVTPLPEDVANPLMAAGGLVYLAFIMTTLFNR